MPEHLLHYPQIRASFEQMGSEGVPKGMRRNSAGNTGRGHQPLDNLPYSGPGKELATSVWQDQQRAIDEISAILIFLLAQQSFPGAGSQRNQSLFASFPGNEHKSGLKLDIAPLQMNQLGKPHSTAIEHFDYQPVPDTGTGFFTGFFDYGGYIFRRKIIRMVASNLGSGEALGWIICSNLCPDQKIKEMLQTGNLA